MLSPLDLNRLAVRIVDLERQSTHDWMPGDSMEFHRGLQRLPSAATVRAAARGEDLLPVRDYQNALQECLRLESLISRNRRTSPQRMMHDIVRGRVSGPWR